MLIHMNQPDTKNVVLTLFYTIDYCNLYLSLFLRHGGRGKGGGLFKCPTKIISIFPKQKNMSFLMLCFKLET